MISCRASWDHLWARVALHASSFSDIHWSKTMRAVGDSKCYNKKDLAKLHTEIVGFGWCAMATCGKASLQAFIASEHNKCFDGGVAGEFGAHRFAVQWASLRRPPPCHPTWPNFAYPSICVGWPLDPTKENRASLSAALRQKTEHIITLFDEVDKLQRVLEESSKWLHASYSALWNNSQPSQQQDKAADVSSAVFLWKKEKWPLQPGLPCCFQSVLSRMRKALLCEQCMQDNQSEGKSKEEKRRQLTTTSY